MALSSSCATLPCAGVIGAQTLIVVVLGRLLQPSYQAKVLEKTGQRIGRSVR